MIMLEGFASVLGIVIGYLYRITGNYGAALILFTILIRAVSFPVSYVMYKNSLQTADMQEELERIRIRYYGDSDAVNRETIQLYKEYHYSPFRQLIPLIIQLFLLAGVLELVWSPLKYVPGLTDPVFMRVDLSKVYEGSTALVIAALTCISAVILYLTEFRLNVTQRMQDSTRRTANLIFSSVLAFWLGYFAPAGAALYWIISNLTAALTEVILFMLFKPFEHVDMESYEKTHCELTELKKQYKKPFSISLFLRSWRDAKRFHGIEGKHLVFYSEGDGFYKYYDGMISWILKNTNIPVHYVTSDPEDSVYEKAVKENGFYVYYIDRNSLIPFMMKIDADVVAMTMPDLDNYQIKRSYVRKDIEYVNVCHGIGSYNMTFRKGAVDHFDTLFLAGPHQTREIRESEELYGLPEKKIVEAGYPLLDEMIDKANNNGSGPVVIAPSWQAGNIMESCIEDLAVSLLTLKRKVVIRPHPQYTRHHRTELQELKKRFSAYPEITVNDDFSADDEVMNASLLISDWSSIAFEYAFALLRPVLFVDTPMKVMNPDYQKIKEVPFDIYARHEIGRVISPEEASEADRTVSDLLEHTEEYRKKILSLRNKSITHIGNSAEICGRYLAETVLEHNKKRNNA